MGVGGSPAGAGALMTEMWFPGLHSRQNGSDSSNTSNLSLLTATAFHYHVLVVLEHDLLVLVHVQHGHGRRIRGYTAGLGHCIGIDTVDQSLYHRVVGSIGVIREWKSTLSDTHERVVARGRNDPIVPAHIGKVYKHTLTFTGMTSIVKTSPMFGPFGLVARTSALSTSLVRRAFTKHHKMGILKGPLRKDADIPRVAFHLHTTFLNEETRLWGTLLEPSFHGTRDIELIPSWKQ